MPGRLLHRFAVRWFPPETVSNVIEPFIADWQHHVRTAPTRAQRRLSLLRGYLAFWPTVALCELRSTTRDASRLGPRIVEPTARWSVAGWMVVALLAIASLRIFPAGLAVWPALFLAPLLPNVSGIRARTWFAVFYGAVALVWNRFVPDNSLYVLAMNLLAGAFYSTNFVRRWHRRDPNSIAGAPDEMRPPTV